MVIQTDLTLVIGLLYQKNTLIIIKYIILNPYSVLITPEIDNIQYEIMNKFIHS